MTVITKLGKELTEDELAIINVARKEVFGSEDLIDPAPGSLNWEAVFFILRDDANKIVAFVKLHLIKVVFQGITYPVFCISTLVSLVQGKGYGCQMLDEIKTYLAKQEKTALLFCETKLLPFYQKCGIEILPKEKNQFYYIVKNGKPVGPNIVPGEVIFVRGKDGLMERVLGSGDKRVGVVD